MLFSIIIVLLICLLANACVFATKLVCRVRFTTCYVTFFVAEPCKSGITRGRIRPCSLIVPLMDYPN